MSNYANELTNGASDKINTADGAMPKGLDHVMSEVSAAWQMPSRQQNSAESVALPNDMLQQHPDSSGQNSDRLQLAPGSEDSAPNAPEAPTPDYVPPEPYPTPEISTPKSSTPEASSAQTADNRKPEQLEKPRIINKEHSPKMTENIKKVLDKQNSYQSLIESKILPDLQLF